MKKCFLFFFGIILLFIGCSSIQYQPKTQGVMTYTKDEFICNYAINAVFYSPFGISLQPSINDLRQKAYNYVKEKYNLDKEEVLLINESVNGVSTTGWSWLFNWMTVFIVNFGEIEYKTTAIKK